MAESERKRKRRKERHDGRKLLPGVEVEVLFSDDGLNGSWHIGRVIECGRRSRLIEYTNLLNEDKCSKLRESIPVSAAIEGLLERTPTNHRGHIRPSPPHIEWSEIRYGLCVDALVDEAWWEGVVFDHEDGSTERLIFFPDQGDQQSVTIDHLRLTLEWNEVSEHWKPRGEWLLMQVLKPFELEETLPVSVREIWYDLRTTAAFSDKIAVWTLGSQAIWHCLVSELLQELRNIVHGSSTSNQIINVPMNYGAVDIPREDYLCIGSNDLGKNGASTSTCLAAAEKSFRCSKLQASDSHSLCDSSLCWNCANKDGSYVGTKNKIKETSDEGVCGRESRLLSSLIGPNKIGGLCPDLSGFTDGNHNNPASCLRHLRKRSSVTCQMAKSDICAGQKFNDADHGSLYNILVAEKHSNSCMNTHQACKENCSGERSHLTCKDRDAEGNNRENGADDNTKIRVITSWKTLELEPAFCPGAIELCVNHFEDGEHHLKGRKATDDKVDNVRLKAKKHLLALGWKIEAKRDCRNLRLRFLSPDGECCYSLVQACYVLLKGNQGKDRKCRKEKHTDLGCLNSDSHDLFPANFHPEPGCIQLDYPVKRSKRQTKNSCHSAVLFAANEDAKSNNRYTKKCRPSSKMADFGVMKEISPNVLKEHQLADTRHVKSRKQNLTSNVLERKLTESKDLEHGYFPKAIFEYKNYMDSLRGKGKQEIFTPNVSLMRVTATEQLKLMGWNFQIKVCETKKVLCIISPSGKPFRSLYSACGGYLKEENLKRKNALVLGRGAEIGKSISGDTKSNKRRMNSRFSSLTCATLGDRLLEKSSGLYSVHTKPKKRKAHQTLVRSHESDSCFSQHVTQSSKRSRETAAKTPKQHAPRSVLSLLIDSDMILPRQKVCYMRRRGGHVMMEGRVTRNGIKCNCCQMVYSLTNFEAHAGSNNRRPAANIFLEDGRSLLQCQMQMVQHKKPKDFKRQRLKTDYSHYKSDTICSVCHDGGSLVLCDYCPSSFHLGCVGLEDVPKGKWFCPCCRCGICRLSEFNPDTEHFTEKSVLFCDQCEREYHVGCMRKRRLVKLRSCPIGNWFCSGKCTQIFLNLRKLLGQSKPTAIEGLSWTILRSDRENGVDYEHFDAETITEHDSKLCVALDVLHECFVTMIENRTRSDFFADLVFNRESELKRLNFYGFYTMLLEKGDELVSVATFRVHGEKVAEMPLVGTRVKFRQQGMCRLLVNELEKVLSSLGVKRLVLPAVPQLLQTWTTSFGFTKMTSSDKSKFWDYSLLNFQDTTMCQKLLGTASAVRTKPKGECRKLTDRSSRRIEKVGSELNSIVSEVVEIVEPLKTAPSLGIKECNLSGEADRIEQISYEDDGPLSPPGSSCIDLVGQASENITPDSCSGSSLAVEISPTVAQVKPSADHNFGFLRNCYEHVDRNSTFRGHLIKNLNDRVSSTFKNFYRRRLPDTAFAPSKLTK